MADSICIDDDEWWFNEIIGKGNKDHLLPVRKRILSTNSLIECLIESGSLDFIWEEEEMDDNYPRRYGRTKKIDYYAETRWGLLIGNPEINNPKSLPARIFRRQFRLPFPVFDKIIVPECDRLNVFEVKDSARVRLPTEFKVLICLRILGRGSYHDDIAQMSGSFKSTCHTIFKQFLRNFTPSFFKKFVVWPTGEKRKKIMNVYSKIGLHGAMGSMDATHIFWARCPERLHNLCIGKEKKPTLAWNCVVDHAYGIHHVSDVIYGATNDMTLARNDAYPKKFANGGFENIRFEIFVAVGVVLICYGAYLITDSGYLKTNCFICPMSNRVERPSVIFSEFVESTRKDVECTFG